MARNYGSIVATSEIALAAATAKTVMQYAAPANQIGVIQKVTVTFDGTVGGNAPVNIEFLRQTTAGTMTNTPPVQRKPKATALQSTGAINATVEPTAGDVLRHFHCHPQSGVIEPFTFEEEIEVPGGSRFGIRITAPDAVNCLPQIDFEE